jgi:hypothetical protein
MGFAALICGTGRINPHETGMGGRRVTRIVADAVTSGLRCVRVIYGGGRLARATRDKAVADRAAMEPVVALSACPSTVAPARHMPLARHATGATDAQSSPRSAGSQARSSSLQHRRAIMRWSSNAS